MTDNEIIKALECCGGNSAIDCYDCPLQRGEITHCTTELATNALDLINRQKAENEELKCRNQNLTSDLTSAKAEIERLREENIKLHTIIPKMLVEAKSEAYKEFAERLKAYFNDGRDVMYLQTFIHYGIDRLVKELTEVSDNA